MPETIEEKCIAKGVKLTEQRKIIARVMSDSRDHPDVQQTPGPPTPPGYHAAGYGRERGVHLLSDARPGGCGRVQARGGLPADRREPSGRVAAGDEAGKGPPYLEGLEHPPRCIGRV